MTTNVPQDVLEDAKAAGLAPDETGDIEEWQVRFSERIWGRIAKFAELRAQRQQGADPVAIVTVGANEHGPFSYRETPYGIDHLPDGETPLYTNPPQANALVAAAYRKAAELAEECADQQDMVAGALAAAKHIRNSIPADAEAALREVCMKVAFFAVKFGSAHGSGISMNGIDSDDLNAIVNSVLGGGK